MGFRFYHRLFAGSFPTFWSLLPLAALVAFVRRPGATLFCACILIVAFSFHSFGGIKAARYVFYTTPFLFAIWGMALAELVPVIGRLLREATAQAERFGLPARMGTSVQGMVVLATGLFLVGSNRGFVESYRILRYGPIDLHPGYSVDWAAASEVLKPIAGRSDVVITTNALAAIYCLGDYDFDMNVSHLAEADPLRREFTVDHETGRPAISTRRSLERVRLPRLGSVRHGPVAVAQRSDRDRGAGGPLPQRSYRCRQSSKRMERARFHLDPQPGDSSIGMPRAAGRTRQAP